MKEMKIGRGSKLHPWAARNLGPALRGLALALFGVVLMAPQAEAQTYSVRMEPVDYEPMPSGGFPDGEPATELRTTSWNASHPGIDVDLPFPVYFYGDRYTTMSVAPWGIVRFGEDAPIPGYTNTASPWAAPDWLIGAADTPDNIIAMWMWNMVCASTTSTGRVQTQVLGSAPNRKFVLDYPNCRGYSASSTSYRFQLWLSESSEEIEVRYGHNIGTPPTSGTAIPTAVIGIRKDASDYSVGLCEDPGYCEHADFPSGYALIYSPGAQVRISNVAGDEEGFAGIAYPMTFLLENPGSKPAENFTLQYWVSTEPELDSKAVSLGYDERRFSLDPQGRLEVHAEPRLPLDLEEGEFYIIIEADPDWMVDISNRAGTFTTHGPFRLGIRAPNLEVPWVSAPDLVEPGEVVDVHWLARNGGNLVANSIDYRLLLERSRFPTATSPTLGTGTIPTLGLEEERPVTTRVQIPEDIEPGTYFIGVEINPNRKIYEHERRDNFGLSLPVVVSQDELVVLTERLPQGHIHGSYEVRLRAAGGDGTHHWSVKEGSSLPAGLRLEVRESAQGEVATFLTGQPAAVGEFSLNFVVQSGTLSVDAELTLTVSSADYALTVATESLASAAFGFEYRDELSAMGGKPPYTWQVLRQDALPHGVFLRSDGVISGRPQEDGDFIVPIRVSDQEGRQATEEFFLYVAPPSDLTCVTQELPTLEIDDFMQFQLLAAGGQKRGDGSYLWTSQGVIRLARELGETSGPIQQDLGLQLEPGGRVHGNPKLFGTFVWNVLVSDDTPGAQGVRCPILVNVPRDRGLTVVTQQLPTAVAGRSFRAQLEASGGDGDLRWSEYGSGRVLEELRLEFDATGALVGTPTLDSLQGEDEREYAITVRVEDEKGRIGIGVVNLTLKTAPARRLSSDADDGGGCQTGSGAPAGGLIALLGLALLRRRSG